MKKHVFVLLVLLLSLSGGAVHGAYDYPFVNPYEATVVGSPSLYAATLPENIRTKTYELKVFEDRQTPELFWYWDTLRYALAWQKKKSPLVFVIAGTGASYKSSKMQILQKAFFQAGFHVLCLPSPTHPNFMVSASTTGVPGRIMPDCQDLYRVMELAWEQVRTRVDVSEFYLTGYSLGGAQAAFLSKIDDEKGTFRFKKVLMINPPVSLFNSVDILDNMLVENIPGGLNDFIETYDRFMMKFAEIYKTMGYIDFSDDFLYEAYKRFPPKEASLAALIGMSFRMSSANMVFTSDVLSNAGFIVPKDAHLTVAHSLTDIYKVAHRVSFMDYFHELFYPYFKSQEPDLTEEDLEEQVSLKAIESYLKNTDKIGLMTNEDDLILAREEVEYLRAVFGPRAKFYPNGGHCGNMAHKDNIAYMIGFFKD